MESETHGTWRFQAGLQFHRGALILAVILLPIRDRRRHLQRAHPFAKLIRHCPETSIVQPVHSIGHEQPYMARRRQELRLQCLPGTRLGYRSTVSDPAQAQRRGFRLPIMGLSQPSPGLKPLSSN